MATESERKERNERAKNAILAMKAMGIPVEKVRPVLKSLLKEFDNNWGYIEADNYSVLVDALLALPQTPEQDADITKENTVLAEPLASARKRLRIEEEDHDVSSSVVLPRPNAAGETAQRKRVSEVDTSQQLQLSRPKVKPFPDTSVSEIPSSEKDTKSLQLQACQDPNAQVSRALTVAPQVRPLVPLSAAATSDSLITNRRDKRPVQEKTDSLVCYMDLKNEPRSSPLIPLIQPKDEPIYDDAEHSFEVPIAMIHPRPPLTANSHAHQDHSRHANISGLAERRKGKELCECASELTSKPTEEKEDDIVNMIPTVEPVRKSCVQSTLGSTSERSSSISLQVVQHGSELMAMGGPSANGKATKENELENGEPSNINWPGLVVFNHDQLQPDDSWLSHDVNDITKGEERVRISVVNEVNSERFPPPFHYIPQNLVYQNGYINFSLARIGDEDCCADCIGDCLSKSIPCACARETGGEFAYTLDGLIKKEFLDGCISMNQDPQKHRLYYCMDCPLERTKNEVRPEPCKGHLVRKFVKECWSKCGCNKQCGNRVVQRGITCNLQVFYASETKGWGLRTLDELPKGAFVCEYVGEIVTNMELYDRTIQTTGNARHTYPVLLDADWGSEGVLKDEEALCLDATFYGNIGRFVNHRCFDANMIEIPVEVESPDHHYYHIAFFTTRKVEAYEELTWDYGIDFSDHTHPIKAFHCCCGSRFCRDMNRPRTKSSRSLLT
ncbi:Histone-lysine N-methyltransferase SUVR4/SUVR1/SUVR2 protein [Dioscorea alata]|uniref:Histone-lysine N-methyltransferase SUVR4/SUVR1/SUVR2 protein n=1 Tax=Dioscorea alata TaxID=55571 RepID=A0ACB7V8F6_DIOAL|nr:Histone-lysine N-methyltransferase SUVR4/SUVR1/SUVR2 protein [Dioscorea alata]